VASKQCDQIGRIFAHGLIIYFGHFLKIIEEAHIFGLRFSTDKVMHECFSKNTFGYTLYIFVFHQPIWSPCLEAAEGTDCHLTNRAQVFVTHVAAVATAAMTSIDVKHLVA
jgi:hypothetical protein